MSVVKQYEDQEARLEAAAAPWDEVCHRASLYSESAARLKAVYHAMRIDEVYNADLCIDDDTLRGMEVWEAEARVDRFVESLEESEEAFRVFVGGEAS